MTRISMCLLAGLFLLILPLARPVSAQGTVLLTTGEWPPFFSESLPHGGVGNLIVAESFRHVGLNVQFLYEPWIRAMQTAHYGPAAGSSGWLRTPERELVFLYSEPIFTSRRVFFHRRDQPFDWQTLEDIKGLRVAVTLGSADEFPFREVFFADTGKLDVAQSYAAGMRKLALGRVDVYACNLDVGLHVLRHQVDESDAALITYHPRSIFDETNHLIISRRLPGAKRLMDQFNEGLRWLKESGRHGAILADDGNRIPVD